MKFYSIRYLETRGIDEFEGEPWGDDTVRRRNNVIEERIGRDCFQTRSAAVGAGIAKLLKKIDSHRKAIRKLEKTLEAGL